VLNAFTWLGFPTIYAKQEKAACKRLDMHTLIDISRDQAAFL